MVYGNPWAGDALYNLRIGIYGIQVSYRFIAKDTVPVNKIRYFNTYNKTKTGYSAGTGGKISIDIQTDDNSPNHNPSGVSLCYGLVPDPLNSTEQLLVNFNKTVILEKGKIYHIVFTNYDSNPEENYVSIDMMAVMTTKPVNTPDQPELDILDMTVLMRDRYNKNWRRFKENQTITPIFSLFYSISDFYLDNVSVIGYTGVESWVREPRHISGQRMVRQRFTLNTDLKVNNVCLRVAKNGNPENLYAFIRDVKKSETVCFGNIRSDKVNPIDVTTALGYRIGHGWVTIPLSPTNVILKAGVEYTVGFMTSPNNINSSYEVFPIRNGEEFGYPAMWPNSWCEYTLDGKSWVGWDAWGNKNLKNGCLQLYLS